MDNISKLPNRKIVGMTFIEVLVALVLIVTGILGAVAMQASAKKGSFDAMQRSLASAIAQDMMERIRANDVSVIGNYVANNYGVTLDTAPDNRCNTTGNLCNAAAMVLNDKYEWEASLMGADVLKGESRAGGLSGSVGCISRNLNEVTVVVSWQGRTDLNDDGVVKDDDGNDVGCGTSGKKRRQVIIKAFIY